MESPFTDVITESTGQLYGPVDKELELNGPFANAGNYSLVEKKETGDFESWENENSETGDFNIAEAVQAESPVKASPGLQQTCEGLVCWAKSVLNRLQDLSLTVSNSLDQATITAIAEFQAANNITVSKKIDAATERALLEAEALHKAKGTAGENATSNIFTSGKTKIEDWTKKGLSGVATKPKFILNYFRDPRKLYAFVLHHMAYKRRGRISKQYSDPEAYLDTGAHFCIMLDGRIIQLHPLSRMIWHGNCTSPRSVAVEFEGNFPNVKGKWWIDRTATFQDKDVPTQAQYDSGKFLASYLKTVLGTTHILAHRQSADSRENDPGPDIWYNVGQWAIENLGMSDGGVSFKCGTGNPILPEWRTWGDKTKSLINKQYEEPAGTAMESSDDTMEMENDPDHYAMEPESDETDYQMESREENFYEHETPTVTSLRTGSTVAFMTLAGQRQGQIKGSVTQKGREGTIAVYQVQHEITSPRDAASGMATGKRIHKPLVITKAVDTSSVKLLNALVSNESIKELTINFYQAGSSGAEVNYFRVKLSDAAITNVTHDLPRALTANGTALTSMERVEFVYQHIEWNYLATSPGSAADGTGINREYELNEMGEEKEIDFENLTGPADDDQEAGAAFAGERQFEDNETPGGLVLLHQASKLLGHSHKKITSRKLYDKANRKFVHEYVDEAGNKIANAEAEIIEHELAGNAGKKIHPTLQSYINKATDRYPIDIAVWLNLEVNEPSKTNYRTADLGTIPKEIADYRSGLAARTREMTRNITIERTGIQVQRISELLPLFFAKATKHSIEQIIADPLVLGIFYNDRSYFESLSNSLSRSGAAEAQAAGFTNLGKDIKVAVWENAPDVLTNLAVEGYYDATRPNVSDHSRLVCSIIKNKELNKPKGYAPNCKLYSANLSGTDIYAPLEWAIKQGCTVINRSFHQDTDQVNAGMQLADYITDSLAQIYPYPLIVQASGNTGQPDDVALGISPASNEYVNHKGFNSIAVGSHDEQTERRISSFSTFRNPASPHNDRELPEICALGENITAVGLVNWAGTSFSSPAVAGSVALLQSISTVLKVYPEATRALLLAGAKRNVDGGLWYEDLKRTPKVDQKDGTGALNIYEAITIAKKPYRPAKIAADKGWDCGRLDAAAFDAGKLSTLEWKIKVPQNKRHIKIAFAWNSNANYVKIWGFDIANSTLEMDLDIAVFDEKNTFIAASSSYDNSFEIADYIAKAAQTLTVRIRAASIKKDAWTYFGIAWTTF